MKLTKYLLFACSALLLSACGNDDDWNTANDVTVQMANATIKAKENANLFYVPLEVVGQANGPIRVTVSVAEYSESPAKENVNYVLTSNTVVIPDNDTQVSLEFAPVNDMEINDDRMFVVTIVNVEGATIGQPNSTTVTITDDDSLFYEAIQGAWTFNFKSPSTGAPGAYKVMLYGVDESSEDYEKVLYMTGLQGYDWMVTEVHYNYDADNNIISLTIPYGQMMADAVGFNGIGECDVYFAGISGGYVVFDGEVMGVVSEDLKTVEFEPDVVTTGALFQNNQFAGYVWFQYTEMTMTR